MNNKTTFTDLHHETSWKITNSFSFVLSDSSGVIARNHTGQPSWCITLTSWIICWFTALNAWLPRCLLRTSKIHEVSVTQLHSQRWKLLNSTWQMEPNREEHSAERIQELDTCKWSSQANWPLFSQERAHSTEKFQPRLGKSSSLLNKPEKKLPL